MNPRPKGESGKNVTVSVKAPVKNFKSKNNDVEEARKNLIQSAKSYEPPIRKNKKLKKFVSDITGVSSLEQVINDVSNKKVGLDTALNVASITPIGKVTKVTKITSKTKNTVVKSVSNMAEFFKMTFGSSIKNNLQKQV